LLITKWIVRGQPHYTILSGVVFFINVFDIIYEEKGVFLIWVQRREWIKSQCMRGRERGLQREDGR